MIKIRLDWKELKALKEDLGVETLWSWSRVDSWNTSKYCWFLSYIKHEKQTLDSIYGALGSAVHEVLEKYYTNQITQEDMISEFQNLWFSHYEVSQLPFMRNDNERNESIANKYKKDLTDFFIKHHKISDNAKLEKFVLADLGDKQYMQGYIDLLYLDKENGKLVIGDFKTSSMYTKQKKEHLIGQLVTYAIAIHQETGIPYEKMKIGWLFLKYCNVSFKQANGKIKTRTIERFELGLKLSATLKMLFKRHNYKNQEEIDNYILEFSETNSLKSLPKEIADELTIEDCWDFYDMTEELANEWIFRLKDSIYEIDEKVKEYYETFDDHIFYDSDDELKKEEFYYTNLCGYSIAQNKCLNDYLKRKQHEDELYTFNYVEESDSENETNDNDWINNLFS